MLINRLAAIAILACFCTGVPAQEARESSSRSRIRNPVSAEPRQPSQRPRRQETPRKALTRTSPDSVINVDLTTGARSMEFTPERYRTLGPEELTEEIERLKTTRNSLTTGSAQRAQIENLLDSLETRIRTGIVPEDLIAEITTSVAEIRGFSVKEPLKFKLMDRDELRKLLDQKLEEELPKNYLPNYEFVLKLMGGIPQRTDLRRTIVNLLSEQIAGLYDSDTKTLYVLKQFDLNRALGRIILAHEICHALQDQHHDFRKMPLENRENDDANIAMLSVLEGDATILMQDYASQVFTGKDLFQLLDVLTIDQSALNKAPHLLKEQLTFPYLSGASFLQKISYSDPDNRNVAFTRHPESTEQIMHPNKWGTTDYDKPTSVALPDRSATLGPGWSRRMSNVMGELQIKLLFENWREWDIAGDVGAGWDGDRYDLYQNGADFLLYWHTVWDSTEDTEEFSNAFAKLSREKRYKDLFAEKQFAEAGNVRTLTNDDPKLLIRNETNKDNKTATFAITNVPALEEKLANFHTPLADDAILTITAATKPAPGIAVEPTTTATRSN